VLDHILGEMEAGRLGPGTRVNAARIAAELQLSVAPVREALSVLAGRGIVNLSPDRGAMVRDLTPREVIKIWEVMTPIVRVGMRLGARSVAAGADTSEIRAAIESIQKNPLERTPAQFLFKLNDWHYAVNRVGGNEFVTLAFERMGVVFWDSFLARFIDVRANITGYLENYRRMHEAVMAGDAHSAEAGLQFHADWSVALIERGIAAMPKRRRAPRSTRKAAGP
jgi:DNA-binding GntR family transcriptional regulator